MSNRAKIFIAVLLMTLAAAAYVLRTRFYSQPLGETLDLPTLTPLSSPLPTTTREASLVIENKMTSIPEKTATPVPQSVCGGPATMYIMAVGSDSRGNHYLYGLADIIRIARIDFVNPGVTVLEMPRDLWVQIPEISDHYNITEGKLNQAYLYGNKGLGYYDGPGQGPGLLARTLDLNFGLRPDHYMAINMQTFVVLVDAVGGLDVFMPFDIDARTPDNPNGWFIEAGSHHFDGKTALMAARLRPINTFQRADNQSIIMCALKKKLLSAAIIAKTPELIQGFRNYVQTDLSPEQLTQLTCLAQKLESKDIQFIGFPQEMFTKATKYDHMNKANLFVLDTDFEVLREYIARFNAGEWPARQDTMETSATSATSTESKFSCP